MGLEQLAADALVAVAVLLAFVHACARYLPLAARRKLVALAGGSARVARWFKTDGACGDGCDSCGSCSDAKPAAPKDQQVITIHRRP